MKDIWKQYNKTWKHFEPQIKTILEEISKLIPSAEAHYSFEDCDDNTLTLELTEGYPPKKVFVDFSLQDSGDCDTGIYGKEGTFHLVVIHDKGTVEDIIPYNYTPKIWVSYTNFLGLQHRIDCIKGCLPVIEKTLKTIFRKE